MTIRKSLFILTAFVAGLSQAEVKAKSVSTSATKTAAVVPPESANEVVTQQPVTSGSTLPLAEIELRPSLMTQGDDAEAYRTEDYIAAGARLNPNTTVLYHQDFQTNLFSPSADQNGTELIAKDGYAKLALDNIATAGDVNFSYQLRLYAPTDAGKRDAGMLTAVRNYVTMTQALTDRFSLSLSEVPIFHAYSQSGNGLAGDKYSANPIFENRVVLSADYQFTDKLSFSLPITYYLTKHRTGSGAKNDGQWKSYVDIYPELTYAITPNYSIGAAYYNDANMLAEDEKAFGDGLSNGIFQLVLRATL